MMTEEDKSGRKDGCLLFSLLVFYSLYLLLLKLGMPVGFPLVWSKDFYGSSWKEEVQLHDGSVVLVKRRIIGEGSVHLRTLKNFRVKEERLEVLDANGEALTPKFIIPWATILLDKTEDGKWFTIVTQQGYGWISCFAYKQYVLEDNHWQQVKFDERLKGRLSNLTWGYSSELNNMPKLLKLSDKPFGDSGSRLAGSGRYYEIKFPTGSLRCEHDDFLRSKR